MRLSAFARAALALLVPLSCTVDFKADQAEYDQRRCAAQPLGCAQGGASSGAGGLAGRGGSAGTLLGGQAGSGLAGESGVGAAAGANTGPCSDGDLRCNDQTPELCAGQVWQPQVACSGETFCQTGQCVTPPSCAGLAADCGPTGAESCCTSILVPGDTFYRLNSAAYPATVSDFRLDKYEITVGRFRAFLAQYPANKPVDGAGAHPNIAGSGWSSTWDVNLSVTASTLMTDLKCNGFATWTDVVDVNEDRPLNCLDWYTAFAFCAWDGGFLPTDLEWNYAAAGGIEQRQYPWGDSAPPFDATRAVYSCYYNDTGTSCTMGSANFGPVGSAVDGAGKWGHFDLAGNVEEWALDTSDPYPSVCTDCANLAGTSRILRGGYFSGQAATLLNTAVNASAPTNGGSTDGARCGRPP